MIGFAWLLVGERLLLCTCSIPLTSIDELAHFLRAGMTELDWLFIEGEKQRSSMEDHAFAVESAGRDARPPKRQRQ